jgi:SAM-dependent methyltransferase
MWSQVFRDGIVGRWLSGASDKYALCQAMTGVRPGDRLLGVQVADPELFAAIAVKTGLTGRVVALVADEAASLAVLRAAEQAGVHAESIVGDALSSLEADAFDLAIVDLTRTPGRGPEYLHVRRVLRPGGRVVTIAGGPGQPHPPSEAIRDAMRVDFPAARVLAERDGWAFVEGLKGR